MLRCTLRFSAIYTIQCRVCFQAVDELLGHGVNASLPLTKGVGSALCVASNTDYEGRRSPEDRLKLVSRHDNSLLVPDKK